MVEAGKLFNVSYKTIILDSEEFYETTRPGFNWLR